MIQLNLLPDVKMEYMKAQRLRRLVLSVAFLVTAASVAILLLLLSYNLVQKKYLHDLNSDITKESSQLEGKQQIGKILTVQNQLESLTSLHDAKPTASRVFDYLNQVTPSQVDISSFTIDFTQQTITITGTTDSLSSVNQYVDTLKFTNYTSATNTTATPAFNNVVLSSFGIDTSDQSGQSGQNTDYTILMSYDKNIFDITQKIKLTVPSKVTTRSELEQPTDLFKTTTPTPSSPSTSQGGH